MESASRAAVEAVARAQVRVRDARDQAAQLGHFDLACALEDMLRVLDAWNRDMMYTCLEDEEAARSQLRFADIQPTAPPAPYTDLPF